MRSFFMSSFLLITFFSAIGKDNRGKEYGVKKYNLHNNNVRIEVPSGLSVDSEYYHFWDNCPNGGYSVAFKGHNNRQSGMNMQLNVHDHIADGTSSPHSEFNPQLYASENEKASIISDTTFYQNGSQYTIVATLVKPGRRRGVRTSNYHLSYYIVSNGRMLELHYNGWDKKGKNLKLWKEMSNSIATSINWNSNNWSAAAFR